MSLIASLVVACQLAATSASARPDTIDVARLSNVPVMDGRVSDREYGPPALRIETAAGTVRVWLAQRDEYFYVAADVPDSTFYWGDDFVISLDPGARAGDAPDMGDRQWYLRRVLDSSVVVVAAEAGRWYGRGHEPAAIGGARHHADWDVAATSSPERWTIELRMKLAIVKPGQTMPRLALRTYNDQPAGWWSWPASPEGTPPQRVERTPRLWVPMRIH